MWETPFSIVFDYSRCDPEFGTMQGNALSDRLDEILREEENRIEGVEGLEADDLAPGGVGGAEGDAGSVGSGAVEEKDAAGCTPVSSSARRKKFSKFRGVSMDTVGASSSGATGAGGLMGMDDDLDAMPASESQMDLMSRNSSTDGLAQQVSKRSSGLRVLTEGTTVMVLPTGVSKVHALRDVMKHLYRRHAEPQCVLLVGSGGNNAGANDEEAAFRAFDTRQMQMPTKTKSWTVSVGSHASRAKFFLDDPGQVVELINSMNEQRSTGGGLKRNAFSSAGLSAVGRAAAPADGRCVRLRAPASAPFRRSPPGAARSRHVAHTPHTRARSATRRVSRGGHCSGFFSKDKMRSKLGESVVVGRKRRSSLNDDTLTSAPALMLTTPTGSSSSLAGAPGGSSASTAPPASAAGGTGAAGAGKNVGRARGVATKPMGARIALVAWLVGSRRELRSRARSAAGLAIALLLAGASSSRIRSPPPNVRISLAHP
jgi:hypothetical protein